MEVGEIDFPMVKGDQPTTNSIAFGGSPFTDGGFMEDVEEDHNFTLQKLVIHTFCNRIKPLVAGPSSLALNRVLEKNHSLDRPLL